MTEQMNIKLTDDPLTNIGIMVTLLNDNAREAISYLMYGCYLGEVLADRKKEKKQETIMLLEKAIPQELAAREEGENAQ